MLVSTENRVTLVYSEEGKPSEQIGRLTVKTNPKSVLEDESFSIDLKRMIAYVVVSEEEYAELEKNQGEAYEMA